MVWEYDVFEAPVTFSYYYFIEFRTVSLDDLLNKISGRALLVALVRF